MDKRSLRLLQVNMQRSRTVSNEIADVLSAGRTDVVLAQEPYTYCGVVCGTGSGATSVSAAGPDGGVQAAILYKSRVFTVLKLTHLSDSHVVVTQLSGQFGEVYLVSIYFQYRYKVDYGIDRLEIILESLRGKPVIIAADVNAVSPLWDPICARRYRFDRRNARGRKIEDFVATWGLVVLNKTTELPTYRGNVPGAESYIDVTFATPEAAALVSEWRVLDDVTSSDHRAVEIVLNWAMDGPLVVERDGRFEVRRADWGVFDDALVREAGSGPLAASDVELSAEELAAEMQRCILAACEKSIPRKQWKARAVPGWTPEVVAKKKNAYKARRMLQRTRDPIEREARVAEYRRVNRDYKQTLKSSRLASWRDFVTKVGNENPWGVPYKSALNRLRREVPLSTVKLGAGSTSDWSETARVMLAALSPDDDRSLDDEEHVRVRELCRIPENRDETAPVGELELIRSICRMKNGKSPGLDGIEVEVLKRAARVAPGLLLRVYNACFKENIFPTIWKTGSMRVILKGDDKDKMDPKSYRPICLLPIAGKVLERLALNRLSPVLAVGPRVASRQFGFRAGRGTDDAINEVVRAVENAESRYVLAIAFDISGAFDNLWWPSVLHELSLRECPSSLYELVRSYLSDRKVAIVEKHASVEKVVTKGCPQGSVLGPSLWNLVFDGLIKSLEDAEDCTPFAYADDILGLVFGNSRRELEARAARVTGQVNLWCRSRKLSLSIAKTQMTLLKGNLKRQPAIRFNEKTIVATADMKYLGVWLSNKLAIRTHVADTSAKATKLYSRLARLAKANWGLGPKARLILYKGLAIPILTYGAIGWADRINSVNIRPLRTAQRWALLATTGAYRTTSNHALCVLAGQMPIDLAALERFYAFKIRRGVSFAIDGEVFAPEERDCLKSSRLRGAMMRRWQERWVEGPQGRLTAEYFPNVCDRISMNWLELDHYVTQFLTGHGDFKAKLTELGLADEPNCPCGRLDTAHHVLFACPRYAEERGDLVLGCRESGADWPVEPARLVQKDLFKIFKVFARAALTKKRSEELDVANFNAWMNTREHSSENDEGESESQENENESGEIISESESLSE